MNRYVFIFTAVFFAIIFTQSCGSARKGGYGDFSPMKDNLLAVYGEAIYKRESCNNCHTQHIGEESREKISLDGVGGKYPNVWLYYYLFEPKTLAPQSKMPAFPHLYKNILNKAVLPGLSGDQLWRDLIGQAQSLSDELDREGITTAKNAEVLALISYIQQIPASKKKMEMDSLAQIDYLNQQKEWDNIALDSSSIIFKIANDEANIPKGKLLFISNCAACHGQEGQGGIGPDLTDDIWLHGGGKSAIAKTIIYGIPEKGMISWRTVLTPREVGELVAFISSLN